MLIYDIVYGSDAKLDLIHAKEHEIHDHGTGHKPSEIKNISSADVLISARMKIYQQFNIKSKIDPLSIVDLIYDKNTSQKDLHFWLSPKNALKFAEHVMKTLVNLDTKNVAIYKKNYKKLKESIIRKIKILRFDIKTKIPKNQNYIVLHDSYKYFEDFFYINGLIGSFYDSNHNTANIKQINSYTNYIKNGKVKCIICDNLHNKIAERFKDQVKIVHIDPIGESIKVRRNSYNAFLHHVYTGYKKCLE